jgi:hypothetical protein
MATIPHPASESEFRAVQRVNAAYAASSWSWVAMDFLGDYKPLRKNMESCWPNILRVNSQLYHESLPLMYKGKTFNTKIDEYGMYMCGHEYNPYNDDRALPDLHIHVRQIRWMHLDLHFGCDSNDEDQKHLVLLTSSLANSLAESGSLKRLRINLKIFDWITAHPVGLLKIEDEKRLKLLLKPLEQLRQLECAHVDIEGWCEQP